MQNENASVLAVMDRCAGGLFPYSAQMSRELIEARAAVAELIAAGAKYHAAELAWACDDVGSSKLLMKLDIARGRFHVALAQALTHAGEAP